MSPEFDFGVNASREGLIEQIAQFSRKYQWHDMALSERGFYAPKRFTSSPSLTNTQVRIWGPKTFKMSKIVS